MRSTATAAALASVCFGASVVATRFAVGQVAPLSLAFFRYAIATACLAPFVVQALRSDMTRRDRLAIVGLGAMFFGVFPWSFSAALVHLPATRVALMLATMPIVTLVISRMRGFEKLSPQVVAGQLLAFLGLGIALQQSSGSSSTQGNIWIGVLLMVITVLCGALFNVFSQPYLKRYSPFQVSALSMAAGALLLAPLAATNGVFSGWPALTSTGWMALIFLGTLGGAVGFTLWIWALQRSTPSRVAVFIALNPITAILLGVLLLKEPVTLQFALGVSAVIAGIVLVNRAPRTA